LVVLEDIADWVFVVAFAQVFEAVVAAVDAGVLVVGP
jgi:hypothetical protein